MSRGDHRPGDPDHLIRHCPKKYYDEGKISFKMFCFTKKELTEDNPYLSFAWLEEICRIIDSPTCIPTALYQLEIDIPRDIYQNRECWTVLSWVRIKSAISKVPETNPEACFMPHDNYPSHVGVFGFEKHQHEDVAKELWRELRPEDSFLVSRTKKRKRK